VGRVVTRKKGDLEKILVYHRLFLAQLTRDTLQSQATLW
jgi:hypothetical protein